MPILVDVDVPSIIEKLLEEAKQAERLEALCKQNRQVARANSMHGQAVAYYHACRLLGWRQWGEGDVPARKIG